MRVRRDDNQNYEDVNRSKDNDVCKWTATRKYNTGDDRDLQFNCDGTEDQMMTWSWHGSSASGEMDMNFSGEGMLSDEDKNMDIPVVMSGNCQYLFASAMNLALATATMVGVSALYM